LRVWLDERGCQNHQILQVFSGIIYPVSFAMIAAQHDLVEISAVPIVDRTEKFMRL
jgi:hypothetical protein